MTKHEGARRLHLVVLGDLDPAELFLAGAMARGVIDAPDHSAPIRYAAHEAAHAIIHGLDRWGNDDIGEAILRDLPRFPERLAEEILCRAVEQLVCADLGVTCAPLTETIGIMIDECLRGCERVAIPYVPMLRAAERAVSSRRARQLADRVLAEVLP